MMPNKLGLGAILSMIFAPKIELRVNQSVQRYTVRFFIQLVRVVVRMTQRDERNVKPHTEIFCHDLGISECI